MKRTNCSILIVFPAFIFMSCLISFQSIKAETLGIEQFYEVASEMADKEVQITGIVDHVCSHSGRRCFLVDPSGEFSVRVEAGDIKSFSRELTGMTITVKGVVNENRFESAYINSMEEEIKERAKDPANKDQCAAEMHNIQKMRDWMKEHDKDFYAVYYLEGISYEVVPETKL